MKDSMSVAPKLPENVAATLVKSADKNGDGGVSLREIRQAAGGDDNIKSFLKDAGLTGKQIAALTTEASFSPTDDGNIFAVAPTGPTTSGVSNVDESAGMGFSFDFEGESYTVKQNPMGSGGPEFTMVNDETGQPVTDEGQQTKIKAALEGADMLSKFNLTVLTTRMGQ